MNKVLMLMVYLFFINNAMAVCKSSILTSTPDNRFSINENGTILDHETSLIWMRCSLGQEWDGITCTGTARYSAWSAALIYAENHIYANSSNWRLPNIKELATIIDKACFTPAINGNIFPKTAAFNYWSSSPHVDIRLIAWIVNFGSGYISGSPNSPSNVAYIRLVRDE